MRSRWRNSAGNYLLAALVGLGDEQKIGAAMRGLENDGHQPLRSK
jgi:hypothetical protein